MVSLFLLDLWAEDKIRKHVTQSVLILILNKSQLFLFECIKIKYTCNKTTPYIEKLKMLGSF